MIERYAEHKNMATAVFNTYGKQAEENCQWRKIFSCAPSIKAFERLCVVKSDSLAQIIGDGSPPALATSQKTLYTTFCHNYYGLSCQIDESDEETVVKAKIISLIDATLLTEETLAAAVFNNAFNPHCLIGDGMPLCRFSGPKESNTFLKPRELCQETLDRAITQVFRLSRNPVALLISPSDYFWALELNMRKLDIPVIVNNYIRDGRWFILTNEPNGLKHFSREGFVFDIYDENEKIIDYGYPTTHIEAKRIHPEVSIVAKVFKCGSWGPGDFRCVVGSYNPEQS
jgi:hypothetical protein